VIAFADNNFLLCGLIFVFVFIIRAPLDSEIRSNKARHISFCLPKYSLLNRLRDRENNRKGRCECEKQVKEELSHIRKLSPHMGGARPPRLHSIPTKTIREKCKSEADLN
jgi:hypothetical protein